MNRSFQCGFLLVTAVATQAIADSIPIDDFNDGNADGWTIVDSTAGQSYGPGTFDASSGAYHLEGAGIINEGVPGGGFLASIWDQSSDPIFSDGFLRATIRGETEGSIASLVLRLSGTLQTGFNGYLFLGSTATFGFPDQRIGGFLINRIENSSTTEAWSLDPSFSFGVNEDWIIEAGAVDDELTLKVWPLGAPEPESPQLTIFDSTFSTGTFGVETNIHEDPFGGPARVSATFDDIYFTSLEGVAIPGNLQAGDADQDMKFDQFDLIRVQQSAKYLTGQLATWGEGDWNGAPGGRPGSPPAGDGLFDQLDVLQSLIAGTYLTGPYGSIAANGEPKDGQTSITYNANTGAIDVDAPAATDLTSINIDSAAGIFTGQAAAILGGSFDNDADGNIFKATLRGSFGSLSFENVAQTGLSDEFVLNDLSVIGSLAGGGDLADVDLVYVPEPASVLILAVGVLLASSRFRRHC